MAESPNRFRVEHRPTKTPGLGNWAVVQSAGIRGRAVRSSRRGRGKRP